MNECEQAAVLLAARWNHELEAAERAGDRAWLDEHLAACDECREMAGLWQQMGALPEAEPEARQAARFHEMLEGYEQGLAASGRGVTRSGRRGWMGWLTHPMPAMAAAVVLIAGLVGGWFLRGARTTETGTAQQMAELREEVQSTRQIAVLSLLRQQSPNDRLQGVSYSAGLVPTDPNVMQALLHSLKYDPSPDVRLAALDTLSRHARLPAIQQGLVDAFANQKSPLVQVAMVDSFIETANPQARTLLASISKNKAYDPEVRKRAQWGLGQPEWN